MNKEEASALWIEYVRNELGEKKAKEMTVFLEDNPDVLEEFEALGSLWDKMDGLSVPEPSSQMDLKFKAMLSGSEMAQSKRFDLVTSVKSLLQPIFESKMALASIMLLIGLGVGYIINSGNATNEQLTNLNAEVYEMKKMVRPTLLNKPKAMKKRKAFKKPIKTRKRKKKS